ncbi:MAG: DUF4416 family protein [Nitrospirota bacterium]
MGKITGPTPVKLFVGMLSQEKSLFYDLAQKLSDIYGKIDFKSPAWPWDHSEYYEEEMGLGLMRQFIFFDKLISPGDIAEVKIKTDDLEKLYLNDNSGRRINLDPGYLDSAKLVLATTKNFSHRIYLNSGIYGEVTLIYSGGDFRSLPYTFPDYRTETYLEVFRKARGIFKGQI